MTCAVEVSNSARFAVYLTLLTKGPLDIRGVSAKSGYAVSFVGNVLTRMRQDGNVALKRTGPDGSISLWSATHTMPDEEPKRNKVSDNALTEQLITAILAHKGASENGHTR